MKKINLIIAGLSLIFIGVGMICWGVVRKGLDSELNKVKENVGSKIVLEKDTLMIIDYSILKNNYTLSNGKEVSFDLAKKLCISKN